MLVLGGTNEGSIQGRRSKQSLAAATLYRSPDRDGRRGGRIRRGLGRHGTAPAAGRRAALPPQKSVDSIGYRLYDSEKNSWTETQVWMTNGRPRLRGGGQRGDRMSAWTETIRLRSGLMDYLVSGTVAGALFAISALALVLTYKTSRIFNFAQGGEAYLIAYIYYTLVTKAHWAPVAAVPVAGHRLWRPPRSVPLVGAVPPPDTGHAHGEVDSHDWAPGGDRRRHPGDLWQQGDPSSGRDRSGPLCGAALRRCGTRR